MKLSTLMALALSIISLASIEIGAAGYDLTGTWAMVANTNYKFDLDIQQLTPKGDQFYGLMKSTSGLEPSDFTSGTILPDGTVKFTRKRPNEWIQTYIGAVSLSSSHLLMRGTFTQTGSLGQYPWSATQVNKISLYEKLKLLELENMRDDIKKPRTSAGSTFDAKQAMDNSDMQMLITIIKMINEKLSIFSRSLGGF